MVFPVHFLKAYSSSTLLSQSNHRHCYRNSNDLGDGNSFYSFLYETD
ncbi:hypothetical protein HMPREF8578_0383 [Streptococcus oralis ATCC 49296]|uniref:Uncharacterized protein n=1 Tax=Streptococcus oralis ATCC 49296 TaxID=888049 RepID=E6KJG8_STROR|nr:hypothetical protein HMPREF8578_0383 [Streptococcus oralis ATCC 49296]